MRHVLVLVSALGLAGCSDAPPSQGAPTPAAAPTPVVPKKLQAPAVPVKETVIQEARKRQLTKDDFTESDTNRDPFRSFLMTFQPPVTQNKAHPVLLEKYTLDELKLAGIVTGELQPRAMFIDPSGQGVTVVRGNHMSKADAVVTRIAADRVYVRIEENVPNSEPRITEREIALHDGELDAQ